MGEYELMVAYKRASRTQHEDAVKTRCPAMLDKVVANNFLRMLNLKRYISFDIFIFNSPFIEQNLSYRYQKEIA